MFLFFLPMPQPFPLEKKNHPNHFLFFSVQNFQKSDHLYFLVKISKIFYIDDDGCRLFIKNKKRSLKKHSFKSSCKLHVTESKTEALFSAKVCQTFKMDLTTFDKSTQCFSIKFKRKFYI